MSSLRWIGSALDRVAEAVLLAVLTALAGISLVGGAAAVAGRFEPLPVVVGGLALAAALVWVWGPRRRSDRVQSAGRGWCWLAAVLMAIAATGFGAQWSYEHIVMDRDPAIYLNGAEWLRTRGDLEIPRADNPFTTEGRYSTISPGLTVIDDDTNGFQSLHLYAVWGAVASWVGGTGAMVRTPALVGGVFLLCLYALASRVVRPPVALFATTLFAVLFPTVIAFRDFFSEMPLGLLVLGGGVLLHRALVAVSPRRALVAGVVAGVAAMARIDSPLSLLGFAPLLALWSVGRRRDGLRQGRWQVAVAFGVGLLPGAVAALADGRLRSTAYLENHAGELQVQALVVGLAAAASVAVVVGDRWRPGVADWLDAHRRLLTSVAAVGLVLLAAALAFVRPEVQTARDLPDASLTRVIQKREGLVVDGTRSYAERSFLWLVWYLGPAGVVAAVAGGVVILWEAGRRRLGGATLLLVSIGTPPLLGYLAQPSIFPDHPWAMRRFLPLALPLLCVLVGVVVDRLWTASASRPGAPPGAGRVAWELRVAAVVVAAAALVTPLDVLRPLREARSYAGRASLLEEVCDVVPADAAVLLLRGMTVDPRTFVVPVQGFCGVPSATAATGTDEVTAEEVADLAEAWDAAGRTLWLVGGNEARVEELGGDPVIEVSRYDERTLSYTISRRPDTLRPDPIILAAGPVG